jgi:hypothetical protein
MEGSKAGCIAAAEPPHSKALALAEMVLLAATAEN